MNSKWYWRLIPVLACTMLVGCPAPMSPDSANDNSGTDSTSGDVSGEALSFGGSLSGQAVDTSSTDQTVNQAAQAAGFKGLGAQLTNATGYFTDLDGNRLKDANGDEIPAFEMTAGGGFSISGLPVGVDIILQIDLDGDGIEDLSTIVNIPAAGKDSTDGALNDVKVDPLSTLALAKLRRLIEDTGLNARDTGLSLSSLIARTRDAFENLFEAAGIETEIDFESLRGKDLRALAELFDALIPGVAQTAMQMTEGSLKLKAAKSEDEVLRAVAPLLLRGGFVIEDGPGGADLSFLGDLPNVETTTFEEMFGEFGPGGEMGDGFDEADGMVTQTAPDFQPTLYVSKRAEVDRNEPRDIFNRGQGPRGPVFSDYVLQDLAELYLAGDTITLRELYNVLVDPEVGMGVRLTYGKIIWPEGRWVDVFLGPDGSGIEVDLESFFMQLDELYPDFPTPEEVDRVEAQVRALMLDFLADTEAPSFDILFEGILRDPVGSAESYGRFLRSQRVHLPYSLSGPAFLWVVADSDQFENPDAAALTVDVDLSATGRVERVRFNAAGEGRFWLGFGPYTESGQQVEFIHRRTGRRLHTHDGEPIFLDMSNGNVFQSINGVSFYEQFSKFDNNLPMAPALSVPNLDYDPSQEPSEMNPPEFNLLVVMTDYSPDAEPVRVSYGEAGVMVDEGGQYYLVPRDIIPDQFVNESAQDAPGCLGLVTENGDFATTFDDQSQFVCVSPFDISGFTVQRENFRFIPGIEVRNPSYDPSGAPYYDDINSNGMHDAGEPTFDFREFLFDPNDWRSTYVEAYYRTEDGGRITDPSQIDWASETPKLIDGTRLVPRNFKPRLNGWKFGQPNVASNLITTFSPPSLFNGQTALSGESELNPWQALAISHLVFSRVHNVPVRVDWDGPEGPLPEFTEVQRANLWVVPISDPVQLLVDGIEDVD